MAANFEHRLLRLGEIVKLRGIQLGHHQPAFEIVFVFFQLADDFPLGLLVFAELDFGHRPSIDRPRLCGLQNRGGAACDRNEDGHGGQANHRPTPQENNNRRRQSHADRGCPAQPLQVRARLAFEAGARFEERPRQRDGGPIRTENKRAVTQIAEIGLQPVDGRILRGLDLGNERLQVPREPNVHQGPNRERQDQPFEGPEQEPAQHLPAPVLRGEPIHHAPRADDECGAEKRERKENSERARHGLKENQILTTNTRESIRMNKPPPTRAPLVTATMMSGALRTACPTSCVAGRAVLSAPQVVVAPRRANVSAFWRKPGWQVCGRE